MKVCHVVGAGEFFSEKFNPVENEYIIAADGGFDYCTMLGINPDMVLGDFDSIHSIPIHKNILKYPVKKDDTDMMIAVKKALEMGYDCIFMHACLGGRLDHSFANIQTLQFIADNKAVGYMLGKNEVITVIKDAKIIYDNSLEGNLSVFAVSDVAKGVCITGAEYELDSYELSSTYPIGVSNKFIGKKTEISVDEGMLMIIWSDYKCKYPNVDFRIKNY